jgi:hypothetical protein
METPDRRILKMALKDWKKVENNSWQSTNPHKANQTIDIYNNKSVIVHTHLYNNSSRIEKDITFKTKSQALKYVKEYMRTH